MSGSAGGVDPNDGEGIEEACERLDDLRTLRKAYEKEDNPLGHFQLYMGAGLG
jgi:hypothetical protein